MEDRYVYILNLTRYRIFLLGLVCVTLLTGMFVLGVSIGVTSNDYKKVAKAEDSHSSAEVHTETFNSLAGDSPYPISREGQIESHFVSSADLLAEDVSQGTTAKQGYRLELSSKSPKTSPKKMFLKQTVDSRHELPPPAIRLSILSNYWFVTIKPEPKDWCIN